MTASSRAETGEPEYDRNAELRAFDETKAGVKGLIDAGITEIPRIFVHPKGHLEKTKNSHDGDRGSLPEFPIIDLGGLEGRRKEIMDKVRDASETWGFFQVLNHGVPDSVLEGIIEGVKRFHEQDDELKKPWYTRDMTKKVVYNSNFDLFSSKAANWRDTLLCVMAPNTPEDMPEAVRESMIKYSKEVMNLGLMLFELLSERLGLDPNYLKEIDCAEGLHILGHYYPACPQPELTMGTTPHTDGTFLTVLLQDHLGGLQVLHQNRWVDVLPIPGALVVNIGAILQILSNDKYKSPEHRVLASTNEPRISITSFFFTGYEPRPGKLYGPIKELVSEENEPYYREISIKEYTEYYNKFGLDFISPLQHFRR